MAKTATERKQAQRERDAKDEAERLARLLAYKLTLDVFKGTAVLLEQQTANAGLGGEDARQDLITRYIHNAPRLAEQHPEAYQLLIGLP